MRSLLVLAAVSVFVAVAIFWSVLTVAALRSFKINLPFSLPFHFFRRKEPYLLKALNGRSINAYVVISGLLLFACPLFAGLTVYDYVVRHFIEHARYGMTHIALSVVWFVLLGICGVWISIRHWQKSAESGIGVAMLAILALKVSTATMGTLMTVVFLIPTALCCQFVYFGIQRIRRTDGGTRYPSRCNSGVEHNFAAEQFVPSEDYKAQQMGMAQKLMAAGINSEQIESMFLVPVDLPSGEAQKK